MKRSVLIAVSGWGFDAGVFAPLEQQLGADWPCSLLDGSPGAASNVKRTGVASRERAPGMDDPVLDAAIDAAPGCVLLGWSLGALRCLAAAARRPGMPAGLVLIAPTARLGADRATGYPGVALGALRAMRQRLNRDQRGCLRDFMLSVFLPGAPDGAWLDRQVEAAVRNWTPAALAHGLDALASVDLRPVLNRLQLPVKLLQGRADAIVPPAQACWLAEQLPDASLQGFDGVGHYPQAHVWVSAVAAVRSVWLNKGGRR